jgi:DNA-binding NarL/FixJ family response regulator
MDTILIADDHEMIRRGIRMIIESFPGKYQITEASTSTEVMRIMAANKVQYAILDMVLADGNLFSDTQLLSMYTSSIDMLVYSMNAESIYAKRLMQKGIRGFICKNAGIEELETAIRCLLRGEVYLSPYMQKSLIRPAGAPVDENPVDTLSDRELAVVEYTVLGLGTKEIAQKMNLDITTISTYRKRALTKLDAQNTFELKEKFLQYKI